MNRRSVTIGAVAAVAGVALAAVEAGLAGGSALGDPFWLGLCGLVVGYWAVFVHWARR